MSLTLKVVSCIYLTVVTGKSRLYAALILCPCVRCWKTGVPDVVPKVVPEAVPKLVPQVIVGTGVRIRFCSRRPRCLVENDLH